MVETSRKKKKKNSNPEPHSLENIFEPKQRRRAAKKFVCRDTPIFG